jgi:DNA-binding ferritin-like protein
MLRGIESKESMMRQATEVDVEVQVARLESDVAHLRSDVETIKVDVREILGEVREARGEIREVKESLTSQIAVLRLENIRTRVWMVCLIATALGTMLGVMARGFHWV